MSREDRAGVGRAGRAGVGRVGRAGVGRSGGGPRGEPGTRGAKTYTITTQLRKPKSVRLAHHTQYRIYSYPVGSFGDGPNK